MIFRGLLLILLSTGLTSTLMADEAPAFADDQIDLFETKVVGILEANCLKCHGGPKPKGGLDLTRRDGILTGGESGAAVDFANPAESLLLKAINYEGV